MDRRTDALSQRIARTIRAADTRIFFENYTKQADAVLDMLREQGLTIVPLEPSPAMIEAGKESLKFGHQKPAELIRRTYVAMVKTARLAKIS